MKAIWEEAAEALHPYLKIMPADPESLWIESGRDNGAAIRGLIEHLQAQHPAAGRIYHVTRCWTALAWQPLFLAVAAVHDAGVMPDFRAFRQKVHPSTIYGYQCDEWLSHSDEALAIATVGPTLRLLLDDYASSVRTTGSFPRALASQLAADIFLEGFARSPGFARHRIWAGPWLRALNLPERAEWITIDDEPTVKRHSCCQHHRIACDERCGNCPSSAASY